jgi:hypothetical protein
MLTKNKDGSDDQRNDRIATRLAEPVLFQGETLLEAVTGDFGHL